MANILKTEAIILAAQEFRESSLICSAFSKKYGKLKLMAKGARRPTSKFCGAFEPFCIDDIIFYKKETREIYTLSDATTILTYDAVRQSIVKLHSALVLCEFLDKIMPMEEPDHKFYDLALVHLRNLNQQAEIDAVALTYLFLLKALEFAGVKPTLVNCMKCHQPLRSIEKKYNFSIRRGGLVCNKDFDDSVVFLNAETVKTMRGIYDNKISTMDKLFIADIKNLIPSFIYLHLHGINLNSLRYLR